MAQKCSIPSRRVIPRAQARHHEAIYHLGRILFERERDLDAAISKLREVTALDRTPRLALSIAN